MEIIQTPFDAMGLRPFFDPVDPVDPDDRPVYDPDGLPELGVNLARGPVKSVANGRKEQGQFDPYGTGLSLWENQSGGSPESALESGKFGPNSLSGVPYGFQE
jgi:hypothetical protein